MPYTDNIPNIIKNLPKHAQDIFLAAFNNSFHKNGKEADSFKIAWAAVKNSYKKIDDKWVAKNFSGFEDYVEIFSGGEVVDSSGMKHNGNELINKALAIFDASIHEPPVVVGHPKDNEPAYGWVSDLKKINRDGKDILLAQFKDVDPDFADLVSNGRYKKRSASFYPAGGLRHVAYLGAIPPAVKGLKNMKFGDTESYILFYENKEEDNMSKEVEVKVNDIKALESSFAEKELAFTNEKAALEASFAEKETSLNDEISNLKKQLEEISFNEKKTEISNYIEKGISDGIITPAQKNAGLQEFMEYMLGNTFNFNESEVNALDIFKKIIESRPAPSFKEVDTEDKRLDKVPSDPESLIQNYMEVNKVEYGKAALEVSKQRPELF